MKPTRYLFVLLMAALGGCMTLSGNYALTLKDSNGQPLLSNTQLVAQGTGIYTMRNAMCASYPGAIVTITDLDSGAELSSESPYRCP